MRLFIKKVEKYLPFAFCLLLVLGLAAALDQYILSSKLIRLHVIANSDFEYDQQLKLQVRDVVLEKAADFDTLNTKTLSAVQLNVLLTAAEKEIARRGYDYPVSIFLGDEQYNTRYYDSFTLPAGTYNSLRIVIGEGAGQNWWCVLFPPLCSSVSEDFDKTAKAAGISEDEVSLIKGEKGYAVRFKCVEIVQDIISFFK